MKKTIIILGATALISVGNYAAADVPGTGHTTEVTPGDWDDDDPKLNFNFQDIPTAKYSGLKLHLSCGIADAKILYTTDSKATPADASAWTVYTGPIDLTEDCTVRFFARCEGYNDSDIQTFGFVYSDYQAAAPSLAPDIDRKSILMVTETPDAIIRYTFDGSDPSESSHAYDSPIAITANGIFKARSFANGMFPSVITEYTVDFLQAETPSATFEGKHLVLSSSEADSKFYYTFGDAPTTDTDAWKLYSAPLALTEDCTVRYFASHEGYHDSEVGSFSFFYSAYQVAAPVLTADGDDTHVEMTCSTPGAEIRYTTDGNDPTIESTLYKGPVEIVSNGIFRARAFAEGMFESNVTVFTVMHLAVPTPAAAFEDLKLKLSCSDSQATILYSTDINATPDNAEAWTEYKAPIELTEDCTVRFFGRRDNFNDSDIQSFSFVYTAYQAQAPVITRNAQGTHIVITSFVDGGTIRYTTDGSIPTATSAIYETPVRIAKDATYHARVFVDNMFESEVAEYAIGNSQLSVPTAEFVDYSIVLSSTDKEAQIWYTHDHELSVDNIDNWILYDQPIQMTEDGIIRFFAGDDDANASDVQMFVYQRSDYQVPAPVIMRSEDERSLIMTVDLEGAEIRYTTDGSEPTNESELYTNTIFLTSNCTFIAKAFMDGMYDSAASEFTVSNLTMMTPYASFENLLLSLSVWDESGSIWYTLNPEATPEDSGEWTLYTEPLALDSDCLVRYFARRFGFLDSQIASYEFIYADWQVAAPGISEDIETNTVVISCPTEDAIIRYTLDGSEPTVDSEIYTGPIEATNGITICARAFAEGLFDSEICEFTPSGLSSVKTISYDGVKICKDGSNVVVYSDKALSLPVYTLAGQLVKILNVEKGRNVINFLDNDIYIIGDRKIKL